MSRKVDEFVNDIPNIGEVLIEPFYYVNGRLGFMCTTSDDVSFNLTLNVQGVDERLVILKMYHFAKEVNDFLLEKTDLFDAVVKKIPVGRENGLSVIFNNDYYLD